MRHYDINFILVRNVVVLPPRRPPPHTAQYVPLNYSSLDNPPLVGWGRNIERIMALSGIRMLSVISGRRMNSLSPFASSSISTKLKLKIHDTSFGRVNINIHLPPCNISANFFSTSSKLSVATSSSSAAAAKVQTRQRLKWKIIARVAYYLRVRLMLCSLFDFLHTIKFRIVYDTSCALIYLTQHLTFFFKT